VGTGFGMQAKNATSVRLGMGVMEERAESRKAISAAAALQHKPTRASQAAGTPNRLRRSVTTGTSTRATVALRANSTQVGRALQTMTMPSRQDVLLRAETEYAPDQRFSTHRQPDSLLS